jgi:hypothetical protein
MGVFFGRRPGQAQVVEGIKAALETDPQTIADTSAEAKERAAALAQPDQPFYTARFVVAVLIFACIVGAAIGTDAAGLSASSKALYGFAAAIFGVVVGLLGGEKSAA